MLEKKFGVVVVFAALFGCGRGESAEARQIAQMRDELAHSQAERDRVDQRLSTLEVRAADDKDPAPPTAAKLPPLRVVRLSPDDASDARAGGSDDPDDRSPRPSIRISGVHTAPGRPRGTRANDQIEERLPDDSQSNAGAGMVAVAAADVDTARPSALDPEARRTYDAALALVRSHQYAQALDGFAAFLIKWPDHPNADNAMYWRGECYFAQGDFARALEQFEGAVARFPLGNKVSDCLLKGAMCAQKLGNLAKAKILFDRLRQEFPRSEAARHIPREESP